MRKLSVALSMAIALSAATAISAFCASVVGEVPGTSRGPLSCVQLSLTNHLVLLAQPRVHEYFRRFAEACGGLHGP